MVGLCSIPYVAQLGDARLKQCLVLKWICGFDSRHTVSQRPVERGYRRTIPRILNITTEGHQMKSMFAVVITILLSISVFAQDRVKASVLYSNIQAGNQLRPGATVQLDFKIYGTERARVGLIVDAGNHLDTKRVLNLRTLLFGFQFSYRAKGNLTPFVHTMYGALKPRYTDGAKKFDPYPIITFGGGVDFRINDRFSIRVLQVDVAKVDRIQPSQFIRFGSGLVIGLF